MSIESKIKPVRYLTIIAVISTLFGSLLMFVLGATKTVRAYIAYFGKPFEPDNPERMKAADQATAHLIQSIDAFLIALVLMIFAVGVYKLFIRENKPTESPVFAWIKINSVQQLKGILVELVVVILFVKFLEVALVKLGSLEWEMLVLPVAILLLALSVKFLEFKQ
ncbi:YqhA family protein [Kaarinaea lacus]